MYKIIEETGEIVFPDGVVLPPPYDSERYFEYADFVQGGGMPELITAPVELPTITVNRFQLSAALWQTGDLEKVEAFAADPNTDMLVRLAWKEAPELSSDSLFATAVADLLGLSESQMRDVFVFAATITG